MASARLTRTAEQAVREVYDVHYGPLVGWTNRLVSDQDLAHDLVTEAFVKLLRHYADVHDARPWLYTTVGNLVRDHWRKRGRESAAYLRLTGGASLEASAAPSTDEATRITVADAVTALPDRLRLPVILYYYGDSSIAQIAAQLGYSQGTVKRDLYDARALLSRVLEGVR